jgi:hypothetical protein
MKSPTIKKRFQYWFDNYMSRGAGALIFALFVLSAVIIFIIAALVKVTGSAPNNESLSELAWMSLLRTLDSGTMGGDTGGFFFLFMMLVVTFGGIFVVSALIGVLNNAIEGQMERL